MIRHLLHISYGDKQLTENFKLSEFRSKCGSEDIVLDLNLVQRLQLLRNITQKPITINSGYRSPKHNSDIGGSKTSLHMKGMAADIVCNGFKPADLAKLAAECGFTGIGIYTNFLHVDIGPQRYWSDGKQLKT